MSNTIYIIGDIDEVAFKRFDLKLRRLEANSKIDVVNIVLSSSGGSAMDAIAFFDRISSSSKFIHIKSYGLVASAAVLILAAGDKRRMGKNSWVMVHEDTTDIPEDMRVTSAEKNIKHSRRLEDQWNEILSSATKVSPEVWKNLHKEETYLTAEECLKLGLIDEVI